METKMQHEMIPLGMSVPQIAGAFAASGLFDDARGEAQAITKIIAGRDYGLGPFASMSGLHVLKGKVEVGGHVIAGAIKDHPKYNYVVEAKTDTVCRLRFEERDDSGQWQPIGVEEFTLGDAERAGLSHSQTYKKYPKNMLFNRAVSNGYKTYCPDVFRAGPVYSPGELGGKTTPEGDVALEVVTIDAEVVDAAAKPKPKAKPRPRPKPKPEGPPPQSEEHQQALMSCRSACNKLRKAVGETSPQRILDLRGEIRAADYDGPSALNALTAKVEAELAVVSDVRASADDGLEVPA